MGDDEREPQAAEEQSAATTDGWTVGIPMAADAAGAPRGGDGDGEIESEEPTQGADPDLAVAPRRDEEE